jgi:glycosyltransferase involved in cell wall biosynthesis
MARTVLHLIDTGGPGGAETIYADLLDAPHDERVQSVAVVPEVDWLFHHVSDRGHVPLVRASGRSFDIGYLSALIDLVRSRHVDLIQTHLWTSAVYGSLAGRLTGVPVVCTFHGSVDVSEAGWRLRAKSRIIDRSSNRIVFVSESLRRWLVPVLQPAHALSHTIANGIDIERFRPGFDSDMRRILGAADDRLLVGAIGNVRPAKDYPMLVRAFAELSARMTDVHFVVVGDTRDPVFPELLRMRDELGLTDRLTFAGFHDDVARVFRALDLFVLGSSSEGFSLATVQALAAGVPVVATRCGGPEEIIEHARSGFLVDSGNWKSFADGMERVLRDAELRAQFRAAGRRTVERSFSRKAMLERYQALYSEMLGEPSAQYASTPGVGGR